MRKQPPARARLTCPECPDVTGTEVTLEIHARKEHGEQWREVLDEAGRGKTADANPAGTKPYADEDQGARTIPASPGGAGPDPLDELPSDDARSQYQHGKPTKRRKASRARKSVAQTHEVVAIAPRREIPEGERIRSQRFIDEAKRLARGERE